MQLRFHDYGSLFLALDFDFKSKDDINPRIFEDKEDRILLVFDFYLQTEK